MFHFGLLKDAVINLNYEIYSIIKHNKPLAQHKVKNEIRQLFSKYKQENDFMTTKTNKRNQPHKFVLNLSQRLDLKILNKYFAQNVSNNKSNAQ